MMWYFTIRCVYDYVYNPFQELGENDRRYIQYRSHVRTVFKIWLLVVWI